MSEKIGNSPSQEPGEKGERTFTTSETQFELGGERFTFETYNIGKTKEHANPGAMNTGLAEEVLELYKDNPLLVSNNTSERYVPIPYQFLHGENGEIYGDYSSPEGQDEFKDADLVVDTHGFEPPEWAADLWKFSELKQARTFRFDETVAAMHDLKIVGGKTQFTVGPGKYSQGFYSMGSEGVILDITDAERRELSLRTSPEHMAELDEVLGKLVSKYGAGTQIRKAIFKELGHLPEYGEHVYNSILGVAGTVLTNDGNYILVNRGKNVSVNFGMNVTASGGVKFDKDHLSQHGIQRHLGREMGHEAGEEIGLKSGALLLGSIQERIKLELGVDEEDYELIPVGYARELPRGGSPEAMFLIRYKGTTTDLVNAVIDNTHDDVGEIDQLIYSIPTDHAAKLIQTPGATGVIQHKGVLNLVMINEYLKKHGGL